MGDLHNNQSQAGQAAWQPGSSTGVSFLSGGVRMNAETKQFSVEEQLCHLDESVALSRVGGDVELLREVVGLFLDDYPQSLELIREAVAKGDQSSLERHAHSLKGSVSTFGADEAFEAALALEKQGRTGDLACAQDGLRRLEHAMIALRPELEALQTR
jgi:HPt (histidine-containing phosphotransfer) domain-containing protein